MVTATLQKVLTLFFWTKWHTGIPIFTFRRDLPPIGHLEASEFRCCNRIAARMERLGNFYTNIALRTGERDALIDHMRSRGYPCFVAPTSHGYTTVYDSLCDQQDVRNLEALASDLSSRFHCTALAVLNHDDSILWMGLFRDGKAVTKYRSDQALHGNSLHFATEFNVLGLLPLLWGLMRFPFMLFEVWRHAAIAWTLGIPEATVGFGYDYLARGERPSTPSADQFERI